MTDTNEDGWVPWAGGECPVERQTRVDVRWNNNVVSLDAPAGTWSAQGPHSPTDFWSLDLASNATSSHIVAYKIVRSA